MKVLHMTRTIELTQSEATKASKPGSDAYKDLNKILSDFPSYEITVAKPKKSSAVFKGMDCSFMEEYISRHDETGEKMEAYKKLRADSTPYGAVRKWFVDAYPQFKEFTTRAQWILAA